MKKSLLFWSLAALGGPAYCAFGAILTSVPMQGGMVMPMVSYSTADGHMHVTSPLETPTLLPLLVSNPGDSFDPADPWFNTLDPSAQGASFSRRYGFVMDANTELLPANTQIWIRKLSGSPELKLYRYRATDPKAWEPIFGTEGVTNALYWNGMMFHPGVAAAPGTNNLSAVFEIYLLDTVSGAELQNSSSGPLELNWTNEPDGRPELQLNQRMVIDWPVDTSTNWVLECAASANAADWTTVTNTPVLVDGKPSVVLEGSAAQEYFRMRFIP